MPVFMYMGLQRKINIDMFVHECIFFSEASRLDLYDVFMLAKCCTIT